MRSAGLFDLQVNGYGGVDFNDDAVTAEGVDRALEAMRRAGVLHCLPTLITAPEAVMRLRLRALDRAVAASRLGPLMVPGYHLEGPCLNPEEGYHGCHPAEAMVPPDAGLVARLGRGLARPVLLVTLAPERDGGIAATEALAARGVAVALGHSAAGYGDVRAFARAGGTLSTHLGNGLPKLLPKLDNTLLAQLAEPGLAACLIADGIHVPPDAVRALAALKGPARVILVTDAVVAAAAPPGPYRFAGMAVVAGEDGTVRMPPAMGLAGSSLRLDAAVRNVVDWGVAPPAKAAEMVGDRPRAALARALARHGIALDAGELLWDDGLAPRVVRDGAVRGVGPGEDPGPRGEGPRSAAL